MASPVSHIVYAKRYLEKHPSSEVDKDEFILGCAFPDIRRIDKTIKRKDTHLRFNPIDLNFHGLSSFQAGWKFHLYCDMRREYILNQSGFYHLDNTTDFWNLSAKFVEDEIIYNNYNNWEKIVHYFNNVPRIETGINVSQETFELWFAMLAKYFEKQPDGKSIKMFLSKQDISEKSADVVRSIEKLARNKEVVETLQKVKGEII